MRAVQQLAVGLASAALVALAAWVYSIGNRVTAAEANHASIAGEVHEIHEDVRELRRAFLGGK